MLQLIFLVGFYLSFSAFAVDTAAYTTPVNLDGEDILVYFNDGDTFKILTGPLKDTRARLKGFNALESYGPIHRWGHWKTKELYNIAKAATDNAREGRWTCVSESVKDVYGRILVNCADLGRDQVRKGLAHVMILDKGEENEKLLELQQEAIQAKLGMWKKGAIDYILTSTHSSLEKKLDGKAYDRFVSVQDGRSLIRRHHNGYKTCETISYTPDEKVSASSMIYVPFEKRYGDSRAVCLE